MCKSDVIKIYNWEIIKCIRQGLYFEVKIKDDRFYGSKIVKITNLNIMEYIEQHNYFAKRKSHVYIGMRSTSIELVHGYGDIAPQDF